MLTRCVFFLIVPILLCTKVICNEIENLAYLNKKTMERWGEYCVTTPNKKLGECIQFNKCDYLNVVQDNLKFAKENICGTASYTPLVCCPLSNEDVPPHNTLLPTECFNSQIVQQVSNGVNATPESSPWIVLLSHDDVNVKNKAYICGGSLINGRYVVTAAHCLKVSQGGRQIASVHLGEWDFTVNNYTDDRTRPIDVGVEEIIAHPNYRSDNKLFDIGLIRMSRSILNEYSPNMRPINLPYFDNGSPVVDYQISGFGQTETEPASKIKQVGNIRSVPYAVCREQLRRKGGEIHQIQLCATSNRTDTCYGDSGGSLAAMKILPGSFKRPCFYLLGIVSYGSMPCGTNEFPSIYTNILPFLEWISQNIKD